MNCEIKLDFQGDLQKNTSGCEVASMQSEGNFLSSQLNLNNVKSKSSDSGKTNKNISICKTENGINSVGRDKKTSVIISIKKGKVVKLNSCIVFEKPKRQACRKKKSRDRVLPRSIKHSKHRREKRNYENIIFDVVTCIVHDVEKNLLSVESGKHVSANDMELHMPISVKAEQEDKSVDFVNVKLRKAQRSKCQRAKQKKNQELNSSQGSSDEAENLKSAEEVGCKKQRVRAKK